MSVFYDVRLVFHSVVCICRAQQVEHLEVSLISVHDYHLDTFYIAVRICIRYALVHGLSKADLLVGVG